LDDRTVVAHVIDDPDEAVIEYRDRFVEDGLQARRDDTAGGGRLVAKRLDIGLLFGS
jgi:hypothetical protein